MMVVKKIGTHSGHFHCDEALACFLLRATDEFYQAEVVRSRDPAVLEKLDILCDVGAVYDPATCRFDHHQKSFTETFSEKYDIKLSSAGLIYKHYGREVVSKILGNSSESDTELIYQKVYKNFVLALDGVDNGVSAYPSDIEPKYRVGTALPSRVGDLNPEWNETCSESEILEKFHAAMEMAGESFVTCVYKLGKVWLPARQIVVDAFAKRFELHPSGCLMSLSQACPWKEHLFEIEESAGLKGVIQFCLYEDTSKSWRVQTIPESTDSFANRVPIKPEWWGVRDDALSSLSGIPDCIFVHANGFIGGNKTFEGALKMATSSLKL